MRVAQRQNEILNRNNDIKKLQKFLEKQETNVIRLQNDVDSNIRGTSDKTLELGQVLRSVHNLRERIDKHMQGHSRKGKGGVRRTLATIGNTVAEIEAAGKSAVEDLEDICVYMLDYQAIVEEFLEQERLARKHGTLNAGLHTPQLGGSVSFASPQEEKEA